MGASFPFSHFGIGARRTLAAPGACAARRAGGLIRSRASWTRLQQSVSQRERRESATDMRLDGDEMAADAYDGDAGHATGTYI